MTSGKTTEAHILVSPVSLRRINKSLFVLLIIISNFSHYAESSDDFQLFFAPNEQAALDVVPNGVESLINNSMRKPSAPELNVVIERPHARWLWFNGIVRSRNKIMLLVNDLPCEIIFDHVSNHPENSEPVSCKHVTQKNYSFNFLNDKQALRIYMRRQYIGTLLVGQSL